MSITVRNTKKEELLNVVSVNENTNEAVVDKSYFETSADQVIVEDKGNKLAAGNVEDALAEIVDKIANLDTDVTSVNGQTGAVTLTAGDVGAEPAFTKNTAFNKDFGTTAGTVMQGNDSRVTTAVSDISTIKTDISGIKTKNTEQDTAIAGKANLKGGNTFTGDQSVTGSISATGGVTIGGNLTVKGTTTTVDSTTLQVKDKLIEVAHGNTTKLTTPAGLVAPKYDGTNSGALVFDGDGIASVGDVTLDANGNIDVTKSQLQPLATRTGLVDGNLVKYDGTNQTLVDTGKKVGDLQGKLKAGSHISIATDGTISATDVATAAQGATADAAKAKADTNATDIANIKNGTTVVPNANHAKTADSANRTKAGLSFYVDGNTSSTPDYFFNGNEDARVYSSSDIAFVPYQYTNTLQLRISDDFKVGTSRIEDGAVTDAKLATVSGLTAGVYTALQVNEKGRATAGQQAFAVIGPTDDIPSNVVIGGFVLRTKA